MDSLYFLAVVPPKAIQAEITQMKEELAMRFGSKHALNAPPHITLHMPFKWKDKRFSELAALIVGLNGQIEPFDVELKDFDFFEPRVVFVNVLENSALEDLQRLVMNACRQELKLDNANYRDQPFHPHVTIAFRDLKKKAFYEARAHFENQTYQAEFQVNEVCLLKHDGMRWGIVSV